MVSYSWLWWGTLTGAGILNTIAYIYVRKSTPNASDPAVRKYQTLMQNLAIPFVFACFWRGVFPNIYTSRVTFFDTILCSILIGRTAAFIAELSWLAQMATAMQHVNSDLERATAPSCLSKFVSAMSVFVFLLGVAAETFSYGCVATKCNLYCAIESSLWMSIFVCFTPCCLHLYLTLRNYNGVGDATSAKIFTLIMVVAGVFYVPYEFFVDVPMYLKRYHEDQDNHVHYLPILDGLKDALLTRHTTRDWTVWKPEWFWMFGYFTFAVWGCIFLTKAPRIKQSRDQSDKHTPFINAM